MQKHAVSNKPPCKVQTFSISPLPSNKPPFELAPMSNFKFDNKPTGAKSRIYGKYNDVIDKLKIMFSIHMDHEYMFTLVFY